MVMAFGGPSSEPMKVKGLRIDSFFDSITEKFKYLIGVRFREYKFPVVTSEMYIMSILGAITISENERLFVGWTKSWLKKLKVNIRKY